MTAPACPRCKGDIVIATTLYAPHARASLKFEPWACMGCGLAFGSAALGGPVPQVDLFSPAQIKAGLEYQ